MALMPYGLVKRILFLFNAETAHELSLRGLNVLHKFNLIHLLFGKPNLKKSIEVMGVNFPNRVGLAAGLDKDGEYFQALSACGFGFVEIGTVTPLAQEGNEKPRLFRLEKSQAIINRMGFNNKGVDNLLENVKRSGFKGVLGINIGKNKNTVEDQAVDDYLICLEKVYSHADYITINISSPNTPGLRDLQFGESLQNLLRDLKFKQRELTQQLDRYVPLVVKVAPDMTDDAIESLAKTFIEFSIDGVIVSNTTLSREGVENIANGDQQGGLSGRPLKDRADHSLQVMAAHLQQKIPIIAVGGINSADDAQKKIQLGASLVQIYTGFIYQGPSLVHECVEKI
ncbi:Dihydroorotate dehydrogenase (quinone) [hydrothermal vent metagenome]|uniref:dihydroorotate dehydrogenase (quinone) n=1 Tax=hydrothermal vent metagenome TaxID=652676 RepID=A0A3B0XM58_9ZZZZ